MTPIEGTFTTMGWDETPYDKAVGHPKFSHVRTTYQLTGGIEGEASLCYLMAYAENITHFVGFATVSGTIDGREGSFVMQDIGAFENDVARGRWTILPNLGARGLRDIRGGGHFAAGPGGVTYRLDVEL